MMTINTRLLEPDNIAGWFVGLNWDPNQDLEIVTSGSPPMPPKTTPGTAYWAISDILSRKVFYPDITGSASAYSSFTQEHTSISNPDEEMAELVAAAEARDERAFIEVAKTINWSTRSASDYVKAIRLAISAGVHLKARHLATEGAKRYPANIELNKMSRILAPPQILSSSLPPRPDAGADMQWLRTHGDEFRGQWVALKAGDLLRSASTFDEIIQMVGNPRGRNILVTKVY
jgi:hypothetical protein